MSNEWWDPAHDLPAFRTRRSTFGDSVGGDYVRGSEDARVPAAALRYQTTTIDATTLTSEQRGLLYVRPYVSYFTPATSQEELEHTDAYHTIRIEWNWPEALEDTWLEYALVRSSYGHPTGPELGVTVERKLSTDPDLNLDPSDGSFLPRVVIDVELPAGRWYYYTLFFRTTPLDWQSYMSDSCLLPENYGHALRLWDAVPPYYQFIDDNIRAYDGYLSRFLRIIGFMQDNTRGLVEGLLDLHWIDRSPMALLKHLGANYGVPYEQGLGDIRYRALLANLTHLQEVRGTAAGIQELIQTVSRYETDVITSDEEGNHLLLPTSADPLGSIGHWAPIHPSTNMSGHGGPASSTYAAWNLVRMRAMDPPSPPPVGGARGALEIYTMSADATTSLFITCGDGKRLDIVNRAANTATNWGRWRAHGYATMPASLGAINTNWGTWKAEAVSVGSDGDVVEFLPLYTGMPCRPGQPFGLSVWVQSETAGVTVTPYFLFFSVNGQATDLISAVAGSSSGAGPTWLSFSHLATAPALSYYIVPALRLETRSGTTGLMSKIIRLGAAMVYSYASDAPVATTAADHYLSLSDPSKLMGEPPKPGDPTWTGYVLGEPRTD